MTSRGWSLSVSVGRSVSLTLESVVLHQPISRSLPDPSQSDQSKSHPHTLRGTSVEHINQNKLYFLKSFFTFLEQEKARLNMINVRISLIIRGTKTFQRAA